MSANMLYQCVGISDSGNHIFFSLIFSDSSLTRLILSGTPSTFAILRAFSFPIVSPTKVGAWQTTKVGFSFLSVRLQYQYNILEREGKTNANEKNRQNHIIHHRACYPVRFIRRVFGVNGLDWLLKGWALILIILGLEFLFTRAQQDQEKFTFAWGSLTTAIVISLIAIIAFKSWAIFFADDRDRHRTIGNKETVELELSPHIEHLHIENQNASPKSFRLLETRSLSL